ncbi:hypothetical protein DPMN_111143 [Dreissena polymorpha]|uniref:Uncharacterized protein n=1 Tax=Dreissena polymorpha TaxID=45954 RepID=A0A9D4KDA9_DREPO|nr:hypothetical protein DPMN_111143 [Dreissena polymorpha]
MPLHNLCLDSNVPLIEELVGNVMEPEVMNNTPVHRAACDKRQQLIKLDPNMGEVCRTLSKLVSKTDREEEEEGQGMSEEQKELLTTYQHCWNDDKVDMDLIVALLRMIVTTKPEGTACTACTRPCRPASRTWSQEDCTSWENGIQTSSLQTGYHHGLISRQGTSMVSLADRVPPWYLHGLISRQGTTMVSLADRVPPCCSEAMLAASWALA